MHYCSLRPLFIFILLTFLMPIYQIAIKVSVEKQYYLTSVTNYCCCSWLIGIPTSGELPNEGVFKAFIEDAHIASKAKTNHKGRSQA